MAKVTSTGNEAKLVLRLAEEQTDVERTRIEFSGVTKEFRLGYETGRNDYRRILNNIVYGLDGVPR